MVVPDVSRGWGRGQAAFEFLVVFSFLMVFFLAMQFYASSQKTSADSEQTAALANRLARQWATAIELATYTDGYTGQLSTPAAVDYISTPYSLNIRNDTVALTWNSSGSVVHTVEVPIQAVTVYNASGANAFTLSNGRSYTINGSKGVVWIV